MDYELVGVLGAWMVGKLVIVPVDMTVYQMDSSSVALLASEKVFLRAEMTADALATLWAGWLEFAVVAS